MRRGWRLIPLSLAVILVTGFTLWKYITPYNNLHDLKGEFDPDTHQMSISFRYLNSTVSLVDYRCHKRPNPSNHGTRYFVSLISQYATTRSQRHNPDIHPASGEFRTEVTIPVEEFDPTRDEFLYQDRRGAYHIPVILRKSQEN